MDKTANIFKGPTVMYGPGGESQVYHDSRDVPEGWMDSPHAFAPKTEQPAPPAAFSLSRDEIKAALDQGGVAYAKNAGVKALHDLLVESLKAVLADRQVQFDAAADAKTLLGLVTAAVGAA